MSVSYLFPPEDDVLFEPGDELVFSFDPENLGDIIALDTIPVLQTPIEPKPKRNTKAIGDRSELEVAIVLARAGYIVSKPFADSFRYDLIIDDGERLSRVQVKTGRLSQGSIKVRCCSSHSHRGGVFSRSYRGEVDFIGVFCPQTGEVYLIPESEIVDTNMHLRVAPTKINQDWHIRWADRYKVTML